MKNKVKAFENEYLIYNRKSTDDADNQKNSLSYQNSKNIDFAKQSSLPIAEMTISGFCTHGVINESHSGYKEDIDFDINADGSIQYTIERPKFLKLIRLLKNKEIKGVIFLCWDRASRNKQDDVLIKRLMKMGCDIRFSQASYDKTSSGDLHMDIDGMFASHYSRVISEKVKNASDKLRADGRCIYFTPIGYLDHGSDNKPFDPERAPIVKRIFELYSTGEWSFSQLAKWANEQGLTTKPKRRRRTHDEILTNVSLDNFSKVSQVASHKTIENILSNPFYIGKMKSKDGYISGKFHAPLVDTVLFNKVQGVLKSRCVSVHYMDMSFSPYRNILKCSCGRAYSPYQKKGINYYRVRCVEGCTNKDKNLRETDVHKIIHELMLTVNFTDAEVNEIERRAKSELGTIAIRRDKELDDLNSQRKKVFGDLDYLMSNKLTLLRTNAMRIEDMLADEQRLNTRLKEIDGKITAYEETAQEMVKYVITFSELVKNAGLYYEFALDNEKREIVTEVFTELVFSGRKLDKYIAKEGFEALLCKDWLSGSVGRDRTCDQLVNSELLYR